MAIILKLINCEIFSLETVKYIHIFCITETHLNGSIKDEEIHITCYDIVRNVRKRGSGGGVCVYVRNDLSWHRRPDLENEKIEAIWIERDFNSEIKANSNVRYVSPT